MKKINHEPCNVCEVIHSIALEETALAHILNAEGEKIQAAVAVACNVGELLSLNESVTCAIRDITMLEIVLFNKLNAVVGCGCVPTPPTPCHKGSICVQVCCCQSKAPVQCALVKIASCEGEIACGETNAQGLFTAKGLECGKYCITVHYKEQPVQKDCILLDSCECITSQFCVACVPVLPLPIACRRISINGCVLSSNGQPCANAKVSARGQEMQWCITDCKGGYAIDNLAVGAVMSVFAQIGQCVSPSVTISNPSNACYNINLKVDI